MVFDPFYKLWLLQTAPSTWVEVPSAYGFKFYDALNSIAAMEATIITRSSTLQSLMTSGRYWRITKHDSTNGVDGTPLTPFGHLTGQLAEPEGDERTRLPSGNCVVWNIKGYGMMGVFQRMTYDASVGKLGNFGSTETPSIAAVSVSNILTRATDGIITRLAAQGNAVVAGTIDTGPSLDVVFRKESGLRLALDLALVGDAANKRLYYVMADTDASLNCRVHYLSPSNAAFRVTNPFTGPDNTRILDQQTEIRDGLRLADEAERVINAVVIQYAGFHTGRQRLGTALASNATSITNNGRREAQPNAPHLQTEASGIILRDTTLEVYKGGDSFMFTKLSTPALKGIGSASVTLKRGELKQSSFTAVLGEMVGVQSGGVNQFYGIFAAFAYDGDMQALTINVGMPSPPGKSGGKGGNSDLVGQNREVARVHGGSGLTALEPVVGTADSNLGGSTNVGSLSSTTNDMTISPAYDDRLHDGINIQIRVAKSSSGSDPSDEEQLFQVRAYVVRDSGSAAIFAAAYTTQDFNAGGSEDGWVYSAFLPTALLRSAPFFSTGSPLIINKLRIIIRNRDATAGTLSYLYNMSATPALIHRHYT